MPWLLPSVCYLAAEFIDHLKKQHEDRLLQLEQKQGDSTKQERDRIRKEFTAIEISREEEKCVRVAALCHDLGNYIISLLAKYD